MSEVIKVLLSSYGFAILLWAAFIYTQKRFGKLTKNVMKIYGRGFIDASNKKINISSLHDHRIAMCGFILASLTNAQTTIKGFETVFSSFPSFLKIVKYLGGKYEIK